MTRLATLLVGLLLFASVFPPDAESIAPDRCRSHVVTIKDGPKGHLVIGTSGPDVIHAGRGNDRVWAGRGDDIICGGSGRDRLRGQKGWDRVVGGRGQDTCYGERFKPNCETAVVEN